MCIVSCAVLCALLCLVITSFVFSLCLFPAVVCNGECGSKHPHSSIYDKKSKGFTVTA